MGRKAHFAMSFARNDFIWAFTMPKRRRPICFLSALKMEGLKFMDKILGYTTVYSDC